MGSISTLMARFMRLEQQMTSGHMYCWNFILVLLWSPLSSLIGVLRNGIPSE